MKKNNEEIISDDQCPVRYVLDRFGDKWSTLVIYELNKVDKMRFGELSKCIDGISSKMLAKTLRILEADGLVTRNSYPEIPPRVEYNLTTMGESLVPHVLNIADWAHSNFKTIKKSRELFRK